MGKYLIAHDLGTSGNKASLFSTSGQLIDSCTIPYEVHFFGRNCAEQNPEDWWNAVGEATRKIMEGIDKRMYWQFLFLLRCRRVSLWIRMEKHFARR